MNICQSTRVFVTGFSGRLGYALENAWADYCQLGGTYLNGVKRSNKAEWIQCDLTSEDQVQVLVDWRPHLIVNAASWTNLDVCEKTPEGAQKNIVDSARNVAHFAKKCEAKLIQISTDAVYGDGIRAHEENDLCQPINVYGKLKREAEEAVLSVLPEALVLRVNFFGWSPSGAQGLVEWILESARQGHEIPAWRDVTFSPLYVNELIRIIEAALDADLSGIYNCGAGDSLTKLEFVKMVCNVFGIKDPRVREVSVKDEPKPAKRAHGLSMNAQKLYSTLEYPGMSVLESLREMKRDRHSGRVARGLNGSPKPLVEFGKTISYGRQTITDRDYYAVRRAITKPHLTQGTSVLELEETLQKYTGAKHVIAVSSGTAAAHLSCIALGLGTGDELLTTPITFVATSNAALYCGAKPVFCDVEIETGNLDYRQILKCAGKNTRVLMPVHYAGQSCSMKEVAAISRELTRQYGKKVWIVEDASHALGSRYGKSLVGACEWSDIAFTSFHPVKHVTTAEGGAIFTNNDEIAAKVKILRTHGITGEKSKFVASGENTPWAYQQQYLGYHYRINDLQCALGVSQLAQLHEFMELRRRQVEFYQEQLEGLKFVRLPVELEKMSSNFHLYSVQIDFESLQKDRATLMRELREQGFITQVHYIPVHTQPYYQENLGTRWGDCPVAENFYRRQLSLPLHPTLSQEDQARFIRAFKNSVGST